MNTVDSTAVQTRQAGTFGLLEMIGAIARRWKLVVAIPGLLVVATAISCLLTPNEYRANTKILPPQQAQSGAAALLAQLGGVAGAAAGAAGIKNPNDLYIGMLKSRTVADRLIKRFDLQKVYEQRYLEKTRRELERRTSITTARDGLITIEVEDNDPKRSAEIANAFAEELLRLTKVLAVTEAGQRRVFFERELNTARKNLAEAESKLSQSLETHGLVSVDAQSRALAETSARIRAQIAAKEIQLSAMGASLTPNHPEYIRTQQELAGMKLELQRLEGGKPNMKPADQGESGLDNIKVLRDVKYYQMLYELLSKQFEIARLDEAKDASIVQILDSAEVPEYKAGPKLALSVIFAGMIGLFISASLAVFLERSRGFTLRTAVQVVRESAKA